MSSHRRWNRMKWKPMQAYGRNLCLLSFLQLQVHQHCPFYNYITTLATNDLVVFWSYIPWANLFVQVGNFLLLRYSTIFFFNNLLLFRPIYLDYLEMVHHFQADIFETVSKNVSGPTRYCFLLWRHWWLKFWEAILLLEWIPSNCNRFSASQSDSSLCWQLRKFTYMQW